jgi:hypothetical protein
VTWDGNGNSISELGNLDSELLSNSPRRHPPPYSRLPPSPSLSPRPPHDVALVKSEPPLSGTALCSTVIEEVIGVRYLCGINGPSLLELRGGGPLRSSGHGRDDGRGVADWLEAEDDAPPVRPPTIQANDANDTKPFVLRLEDHLDDPELQEHLRWLDEHVGSGDSSWSRPGCVVHEGEETSPTCLGIATHSRSIARPPALWDIRGERNGRVVRICPQCACDCPIGQRWGVCQCGAWKCESCIHRACRVCNRNGLASDVSDVGGPPQQPSMPGNQEWDVFDAGDDDHDQLEDYFVMHDIPQANWSLLDDSEHPVGQGVADSIVGTCPRCKRWLGEWGTAWRICRCSAGICLDCWPQDCPICRPDSCAAPEVNEGRVGSAGEEDEEARLDGCQVDQGGLQQPPATSPAAAHEERIRALEEESNKKKEARKQKRELRRLHEEQGKRPRREKPGERSATIVTMNVTAASTLIEEPKYGSALRGDNYLMVQELGCSPQDCEAFSKEAEGLGYSPLVQATAAAPPSSPRVWAAFGHNRRRSMRADVCLASLSWVQK